MNLEKIKKLFIEYKNIEKINPHQLKNIEYDKFKERNPHFNSDVVDVIKHLKFSYENSEIEKELRPFIIDCIRDLKNDEKYSTDNWIIVEAEEKLLFLQENNMTYNFAEILVNYGTEVVKDLTTKILNLDDFQNKIIDILDSKSEIKKIEKEIYSVLEKTDEKFKEIFLKSLPYPVISKIVNEEERRIEIKFEENPYHKQKEVDMTELSNILGYLKRDIKLESKIESDTIKDNDFKR